MIKNIAAVDVYVSDQDKALDFYRDTLGFEKLEDRIYDGDRWIAVAPAGGQQITLALLKHPDAGQTKGPIGQNTNIVFETDDIQATHRALKEKRVKFNWGPQRHDWGNWDCQFCDQDNNTFLLVEYYRPLGRHPMKE